MKKQAAYIMGIHPYAEYYKEPIKIKACRCIKDKNNEWKPVFILDDPHAKAGEITYLYMEDCYNGEYAVISTSEKRRADSIADGY